MTGRTRRLVRLPRSVLLTMVLASIGMAVAAARASAYVYWTNGSGGAIGRADNDGSNANATYITGVLAPALGIGVNGDYIFWSNGASSGTPNTIGRVKLDGGDFDLNFHPGVGALNEQPRLLKAPPGNDLYWLGGQFVARAAQVFFSQVFQQFINTGGIAQGLAVDDTYVYWTNGSGGDIFRVPIASPTDTPQALIQNAGDLRGIAVDETYMYVVDTAGDTIFRANKDGSAGGEWSGGSLSTGNNPQDIVVHGDYLYWANTETSPNGTIGRAPKDGSEAANNSFITGAGGPTGVAVADPPPPSCNDLTPSTAHETGVVVNLDCSGFFIDSYAILSQPTDGSLDTTNLASGQVTYTPNQGFSGNDSFTYSAHNPGGDSNTATVTVTVNPPVPSCNDLTPSTAYETGVVVNLECFGVGIDSYAILSQPTDGSLDTSNLASGQVTYTPNQGFSGNDSFTYQAHNDTGSSEPATVMLDVGAPPLPTCNGISDSTPYGTAVAVNLDCSGVDLDSYAILSQPTDGSLDTTNLASGQVTYTPNQGFSGNDSFTYSAHNPGGDSNPAAAMITVGSAPPSSSPRPTCKGRAATQVGTPGPDVITGTPGPDVVVALGGDDRINTLAGNDLVCAGKGNDVVFTRNGRDRAYGEIGADRIYGGAARDFLFGQRGHDRIFGNAGGDRLFGGALRDLIFGGQGNDRGFGQAGNDLLVGNAGRDWLFGGPQRDALRGLRGRPDRCYGGPARDRRQAPGCEIRRSIP